MTVPNHRVIDCGCGADLVRIAADTGVAVEASNAPTGNPLLAEYERRAGIMMCEHGTCWWVRPTVEQLAQWIEQGVA